MSTAVVQSNDKGKIAHDSLWGSSSAYMLENTKDFLDTIGTFFDWVPYFSSHKDTLAFSEDASGQLGTINKGFAIPGLFQNINGIRREFQQWNSPDPEESKDLRGLRNELLLGAKNVSESAMFLDAIRVVDLKNMMHHLTSVFWGSLGILDIGEFFYHCSQISGMKKTVANVENPEMQSVINHKITLTYLKVVMSVTVVAMAAIALIGIFFANYAVGILFSPVVFLCLSSTWLALNFITFYYSRIIEVQANPHQSALALLGISD